MDEDPSMRHGISMGFCNALEIVMIFLNIFIRKEG